MGYNSISMANVTDTYEKLSNIVQERCYSNNLQVLSEGRSIIAEVHLCLIQWMQKAKSFLSESNGEINEPNSSIFFATVAKCINLLEIEQESLSDGQINIMDTILKITAIFQELKMHHGSKIFHDLELHVLGTSIVCPMLKHVFCKWQPLKEPWFGIGLLKAWKVICESSVPQEDGSEVKKGESLYDWFISSTVLPAMLNLVTSWDALETQPLLSCVETWQKSFPDTVTNQLLDVVAEKLQANVLGIIFNAGSLTGEGMVQWLKPWEAVMPERIVALRKNIYTNIKNTVASNTWSPVDKHSARAVWIWIRSLPAAEARKFIDTQLVPKLEQCLVESYPRDRHFPETQTRQILLAVLRWWSVIQEQTIVALLLQAFFQPWFNLNISDRYQLEKIVLWIQEWTKTVVKEKQTSEEVAMSRILGHIDQWINTNVVPFLRIVSAALTINVEPIDNQQIHTHTCTFNTSAEDLDVPLDLSMKKLTVTQSSDTDRVCDTATNYQVRQKLKMHLLKGRHSSEVPILVD